MEKFGIFELLDALSAFTASNQAEPTPPPAQQNPPVNEKKSTNTGEAVSCFLSRHDEISRRIQPKK